MKAQWQHWSKLMQSPLNSFYWISTDDLLLQEEALQSLRVAAKSQGFEREVLHLNTANDWDHFATQRQTLSLFTPKPFYECHMNEAKFKDGIQAQLQACTQLSESNMCVVLVTPKIESATQKTKWFEALLQEMIWLPLWPLEGEAFKQYVFTLAKNANLAFTQDAWSLFFAQCDDLLSAKQTLMRLSHLPSQMIDINTLQSYLPDTLPCEVFDLSDALLAGETTRSLRLFDQLQAQTDINILILWSLTRDIETLIALHAHKNPPMLPKRKPLLMKTLQRLDNKTLSTLLKTCAQLDRALKGGIDGGFAVDGLLDLCVAVSKGI